MKKKILIGLVIIIVLLIGYSSICSAALGVRMLKFGSVGDDVKELQIKLEQWGYHPGVADGIYGVATERAIIQFQKNQELAIDGIAGYQTINKLKSEKFV